MSLKFAEPYSLLISHSCYLSSAIEDEQRTAPFSGVEVFNKNLLKHVETTEKKPPLPTPQGGIILTFKVLRINMLNISQLRAGIIFVLIHFL